MSLKEIIEKMEKEIAMCQENAGKISISHNQRMMHVSAELTISFYLPHLKKLNETIVSEETKCDSCINSIKSDVTCVDCKWNKGFKDKYSILTSGN